MDAVEEGIRRTTFPLPFGLDHVHCYFLRAEGGWTLVDTGLGVARPGRALAARARRSSTRRSSASSSRTCIPTTSAVRRRGGGTGAPVLQGRADYEQCVDAWGDRDSQRFVDYWVSHGMPAEDVAGIARESERLVARRALGARPAAPGRGRRDRRLAGRGAARARRRPHRAPPRRGDDRGRHDPRRDHARDRAVSRTHGPTRSATISRRWSGSSRLAPRVAYAGHKEPILDPAGRAREIIEHHRERLDGTAAALDGVPLSAYDVSLALFERDLSPVHRRFATAESLAHLRAARAGGARAARRPPLHQGLSSSGTRCRSWRGT